MTILLNQQQNQAVHSPAHRTLVIAGAGSGKTEVMTQRVVRIARDEANPARMLCVTFTRDAARNMRERYFDRSGIPTAPEFGTLHSWYYRLLRRYAPRVGRTIGFTVYDPVDREDLIRACAEDVRAHDKPWTCHIRALEKHGRVKGEYEQRMREGDAIDFGMMEDMALKLVTEDDVVKGQLQRRYSHIFVDEYQDVNVAQALILADLTPSRLFVVGDARQGIYGWRGADPQRIVEMAKEKAVELIEMPVNYRSTEEIVAYANAVIGSTFEPMRSARGSGAQVEVLVGHRDQQDQAAYVATRIASDISAGASPGDIAVLGRTWLDVTRVRNRLDELGVPVLYLGDETDPWETPVGRGLSRALRLVANPADDNMARMVDAWGRTRSRNDDHRAIREQARRDRTTVVEVLAHLRRSAQWLHLWAASQRCREHGPSKTYLSTLIPGLCDAFQAPSTAARDALPSDVTTLDEFGEWWCDRGVAERKAVAEQKEGGKVDAVTLTTVHGAKGMEWPHVHVLSACAGVYPSRRKDADPEEDRRVLYVALTRAEDRLTVHVPTKLVTPWGKEEAAGPSPFLPRGPTTTIEDDDRGGDISW